MLCVENLLYAGKEEDYVTAQPSAPQKRIQGTTLDAAIRFLREAGSIGGERAIQEMLRESDGYQSAPQ
eukprot:3192107-Lingulodinium_polyedra.AAC.1